MTNSTSNEIDAPRTYRILPCFHGACACPSEQATMWVREARSTKDAPGVVLLPGGIDHDIYLPNESIIFPKQIHLDEHDLRNLDCSSPDNFSFTHYGPHKQDKPTNQDFALSGHFGDHTRQVARFAILADGISNGFSFSQRGAQLSCFAAYECLKNLYQKISASNQTLNEQDIQRFRGDLAAKINEYFSLDRDHLLTFFEAEHSAPANIAASVWQKHFKDQPEKWYGNTLLVSFLSPFGGFVLYAGDGGIILVKGGGVVKDVMRSDSTSTIDRFVSMGVTGARFLGALVSCVEEDDFVEIISATDGLDRTYQLNDLDLTSIFSSDASLSALVDQIGNIDERVPGKIDVDNYSIARIFLPLASRAHNRMTGNSEAVVPVALRTPIPGSASKPQINSKLAVASIEKKKAARSMKVSLTPLLLGLAIGMGLSTALVHGLTSMNSSKTAPKLAYLPEMAAAEAAARVAATSAAELSVLQSIALNLDQPANMARERADAAQQALTAAEADASTASERITELTETASRARERADAAQQALTAAEADASTASGRITELTETASRARERADAAQQALTAAEQALLTARDKAERTARIAAETATTAITQMTSPRP